jgi:hypothetical protein
MGVGGLGVELGGHWGDGGLARAECHFCKNFRQVWDPSQGQGGIGASPRSAFEGKKNKASKNQAKTTKRQQKDEKTSKNKGNAGQNQPKN